MASPTYLRKYVTGHGIKHKISERNKGVFELAQKKWLQIIDDVQPTEDSVILFCGAKNNGKSSLVRFMLNNYMRGGIRRKSDDIEDVDANDEDQDGSTYGASSNTQSPENKRYAYYVDFDPGQPEMTTPGIISAHLIEPGSRQLVSPVYLNVKQHTPVAMSSVGGLNMSVDPRMFIENVRFIIARVRKHQKQFNQRAPIFINTMGFIRSVGLAMLTDCIKICRPTDLVVLNVESDPMRIVYADLSATALKNTKASFYYETQHGHEASSLRHRYFVYNLDFGFVVSTSIARGNHTSMQLAYFASIPEAMYKPVMQLEPKYIAFDKVSIYCVSSYPLKEAIVLELLYHSWIHLIKRSTRSHHNRAYKRAATQERMNVEAQPTGQDAATTEPVAGQEPETIETAESSTKEESYFNLIDDIQGNSYLGCGIITDVDVEARKLSVITPLPQEAIDQEVDCLVKPLSIQVPQEMIAPYGIQLGK